MTPVRELRPSSWVPSLLAALTTFVTLLAWTKFAENPAGFMVPILGACLMVAVLGMTLRMLRLPAVLVALAQLVLVLVWLNHREAAALSLGGWVPTPSSVRALVDAFGDSVLASQAYAAPVPQSVPEFYPLMILAGALTAVLVDFLAVGLRRAPLAGLPLLALYTAPVSVLDGGVSWLKFAAAALCFLFLIASEEAQRLSHWGHQLSPGGRIFDTQTTTVSSQAVWASARKIGLTATGVAVVVPLLVPTFSASFFGGGNGPGDGDGDAVSISNPMIDLKRDLTQGADVELIRMTTTENDPSYLRITVLDSFDGTAWRPSSRDIPVKQRADGRGDPAPGPGPHDPVPGGDGAPSRRATTSGHAGCRRRTPSPPCRRRATGATTARRWTSSAPPTTRPPPASPTGCRRSTCRPRRRDLAEATPAPASVFTPNTALPRDLPASVKKLARSVTDGKATKFEQAVALQQFFRVDGGFRYSLERDRGNGTDDLVQFLVDRRPGRLLRAVRRGDGADGPDDRDPLPGRRRASCARTGWPRAPTSTARTTCTPGRRCTSAASAGCASSPPRRTGPPASRRTPPSRCRAAAPSESSSAPAAAPTLNRIDRATDPNAAVGGDGPASPLTNPVAGRAPPSPCSCWCCWR